MIKEKLKEIDAKIDTFCKEHPSAAFGICCGMIYTVTAVVHERAMEVAVKKGVMEALKATTFRIRRIS